MSKLRKWMMKEERDATSSGSAELSSSSAIKLFGKTIAVSAGAESSKAASEEVDGAAGQLEGDVNAGGKEEEVNPPMVEKPPRVLTQEEKKEQCLKKPDKLIPCPRCESVDTKFCYYNNYNINQPRHFCKSCQRYWTAGGTLRNVLVGAGRRKNKYSVAQAKPEAENLSVRADLHDPAQQSILVNAYGSPVTLGTVPPMSLPSHGASPADSQGGSTVSTSSQGFPVFSSVSAFKPTGVETSSDSVTKLRQRTRPEPGSEVKADCASSISSPPGEGSAATYVLTPRVTPQQSEAQAVWTKSSAAPLGFFNGAWPFGYNIGWSGAGSHPGAAAATPPVWTGMWTSAMAQSGIAPVPAFGWNMLPGGWTLPWRPVPAVGVQMQTPSRKRESSSSEETRVKMARVGSSKEVAA